MSQVRIVDSAGRVWGQLMAPLVGVVSRLRSSRMFHPRGIVCSARVHCVGTAGAAREIGARLEGHALVRFSGALWKHREWPDVLGCAIRFRDAAPRELALASRDQDLLLATVRNPWTTLLAGLTTNARDYLVNDYFGVSPFTNEDARGQRFKFRLRPQPAFSQGSTRAEKVRRALAVAPIVLRLAVREDRLGARYQDAVELELYEVLELNDDALRFDPFRDGRGIRPVGLVHHARIATYRASRAGHPPPRAGSAAITPAESAHRSSA